MGKQKQVTWGELADMARQIIAELFTAGEVEPELKMKAKYAASVLSSASRHEQAEVVAERQAYEVGIRLIEDREALLEYIKELAPRLRQPLIKANIPTRIEVATRQTVQLAEQTLAVQDTLAKRD